MVKVKATKRTNEQHLYGIQTNEENLKMSKKISPNTIIRLSCFPLCFPIYPNGWKLQDLTAKQENE